MTIQTTFKQPIGGVTGTKGQPGWLTDGPSARHLLKQSDNNHLAERMCVSSVHFSGIYRFSILVWECRPKNPDASNCLDCEPRRSTTLRGAETDVLE